MPVGAQPRAHAVQPGSRARCHRSPQGARNAAWVRSSNAPKAGRVCAEHLICVNGNVYDVGYGGVGHYGAGASYHLFCGKDASRALAKMSFKPEDVDRGWPDLDDLDAKDTKILDDWVALFKRKYPVVATLHETD